MINCGIKIGLKDYNSKIKSKADFFEISYDRKYASSKYSEMIRSIKRLKKPFFFHLSTSFVKNGDTFLLNYASKNIVIRNDSRAILSQEIRVLSKYHPKGFIVHSPTMFDFSKNRKIIGRMISSRDCSIAFRWLKGLTNNVYVENSAEAISVNNRSYCTKPISNIKSKKYGIKCLLDTGHFYTTCLIVKKRFSSRIDATFLNNFSYFHIATLNKKAFYDTHGGVFFPSSREFPSKNELKKVILEIKKNENVTGAEYYIVCEPSGGSKMHIDNLSKLVELLNKKR